MKKIFSVLMALAVLAILTIGMASAQTYTMTGSGDTITNTETEACSLKVNNPYHRISIAAQVTKQSGTVAGDLTLYGSVDGTNYIVVDSCVLLNDDSAPAVYTATNVAAQTRVWYIDGAPYLWYKISYTGAGTMAALMSGYLLPRKNE
jgi:Phr family secreted Rap phosphatase inhibitor